MMTGLLRTWTLAILDFLQRSELKKYEEIQQVVSTYVTASANPGIREQISFIKSSLRARFRSSPASPTFNFIITSYAELRVFEPILQRIFHQPNILANVLYLGPFRFSDKFEKAINQYANTRIVFTAYPIIHSCQFSHGWVNLICLDHRKTQQFHSIGIEIIEAINVKGGKTVCLQHGSTREDNVEGHKTSASTYQVVWGSYIYNILLESPDIIEDNIYMTGNPLHDEFYRLRKEEVFERFEKFLIDHNRQLGDRELVILATCLHSEYDENENSDCMYREYIRKIYESIDFKKYLLVVKMHPNDLVSPNIYKEQLSPGMKENVIVFTAEEPGFSFYELAKISSLLITRASTVAEEILLIGGKVLAFDLIEDGPSKGLKFLKRFSGFELVVGKQADLAERISLHSRGTPGHSVGSREFVRSVTYKFDGNSVDRVLNALRQIAKR